MFEKQNDYGTEKDIMNFFLNIYIYIQQKILKLTLKGKKELS